MTSSAVDDPPLPDAEAALRQRAIALASSPLLDGLTPEQLLPLAAGARTVAYAAGSVIVRCGAPATGIYFLISGVVELSVPLSASPGFATAGFSRCGPGGAVGDLPALGAGVHRQTGTAVEDTICLRVAQRDFLAAMAASWPLARRVVASLAGRLEAAEARSADRARDPLTGAADRLALSERYARETRQTESRRDGDTLRRLALLFVDVNDFKQVNDTYGHAMGDAVLREVAQVLTRAGRSTNLVARYGGDEFVVLLPAAGEGGAARVAHRVRELLRQPAPGLVPFSVSLGVAVLDPQRPESLDQLVARADAAMYRDKALRRLVQSPS